MKERHVVPTGYVDAIVNGKAVKLPIFPLSTWTMQMYDKLGWN